MNAPQNNTHKERKLFGTDGIRGIAGSYPMTPELVVKLGKAIGSWCFKSGKHRHKVIIGKDTRLSGYMLETALSAGICAMGVDVLLVGPLPTPGIAFITCSMRADAGVVISASHNPFEDNGIKIFGSNGFKLDDEIEMELEEFIFSQIDNFGTHFINPKKIGKAFRIDDAVGRYIVYLKSVIPNGMLFDNLKIVVDCANGAAYKVAPAVFEELGASIVAISNNPNGLNINAKCGSLNPQRLQEMVKETKANIGLALDGDADRIIICDENGEVVDGDIILGLCARELKNKGKLAKNTLVATVMSNLGLENFCKEHGIEMLRAKVGDRYVVENMRTNSFNLGGEKSGHIIFMDHSTTGDGILAAMKVIEIMLETGKPLSDLKKIMTLYPQTLLNLKVKAKPPLEQLQHFNHLKSEIEKQLKDRGRILVRYSGTEPQVRIMVEAEDEHDTQKYAQQLADAITNDMKEW